MRYWASAVIVGAAAVLGRAGEPPVMPAAAVPQAAPASIEWRHNLANAYAEAVEQKKPLVVLFASRPSNAFKNGRNISNEQWVEFDRDEVRGLAGHAVFVVCHFDHATGKMVDPHAEALRAKLRVTELPTTSVFAPNPDRLVEVYRLEGLFPADEVAADLRRKLPAALRAEHLARTAAAKPVAKTPDEAVALWAAAAAAGDPDLMGEQATAAGAERYHRYLSAAVSVGHAKRRLLAALDARFGPRADALPYGTDDDTVTAEMARVARCEVVRVQLDGDSALVRARLTAPNGTSHLITLETAKTDGGWKLVNVPINALADAETLKTHLAAQKGLVAALDSVAKRVRAGEFSSRDAAKNAALAAYRTASAEK